VPLVFAAFVAGNIAVQQLSELASKLHFFYSLAPLSRAYLRSSSRASAAAYHARA